MDGGTYGWAIPGEIGDCGGRDPAVRLLRNSGYRVEPEKRGLGGFRDRSAFCISLLGMIEGKVVEGIP
jgi:hypothetical protein